MHLEELLKRIEKLESNQLGQQLDPKVWKFLSDKVDGLESEMAIHRVLFENYREYKTSIEDLETDVMYLKKITDKLEKSISNWEEEFYFLKDKLRSSDKKPHKCPVCDGRGDYRRHNITGSGYLDMICTSCEGKGIVWG